MELVAMSNYVICEPYSLPKEQSGLIVDNNSNCFAKVVKCNPQNTLLAEGDVIWYDRAEALGCVIAGNKYIAVKEKDIISKITGA